MMNGEGILLWTSAREAFDEGIAYQLIGLIGGEESIGAKYHGGIANELRVLHLFFHVCEELQIGGRLCCRKGDVAAKTGQNLVHIEGCMRDGIVEVEKIASFSALVEGAEFCAKKLLQLVGG